MNNKQQTIVFKVSDNIKEKMIDYYKDMVTGKPPYAIFQVKDYDCVTTLYESGKVMFQGIGADIEANMWKDLESHFNDRNIDKEIEEYLAKKNLHLTATTDGDSAIKDSEIVVIATPTNYDSVTNKFDTSSVERRKPLSLLRFGYIQTIAF